MPRIIRAQDNRNEPLITPGRHGATLSYFNLIRLAAGQSHTYEAADCETICVVLSGRAEIAAGGQTFGGIGERADVWSGPADSVYCGTSARATVRALRDGTEVAVAGGICRQPRAPFHLPPAEVERVDVGSLETHTRRSLFHVLGHNARERTCNLQVCEIYPAAGCWSGVPPHKHDTERPPEETDFEEIYHYRFRPETGFGAQLIYEPDGTSTAAMTRHGDTYLVDRGYHPTVTAPGYEGYLFAILVGRHQRSLVPYFDPAHGHLTAGTPGLEKMRANLK
ncbi:5-deoxy-glucuronate isomerase [Horticoccus luteus]|uniref:5-deoxy-glucuronate isomerase n=1 Tax=Horticoccus luteus TaxID=2862869 RepID=A0A8F9TU90_9BACT|nr:5-deoxy-glucuronate isomerase [Horticoccus luteus]QYM79155.1 5-deoxy-glucuronate isomerase [Horticoccus luteus]